MIRHTLMAMPLKAATASIIAVAGFATSVHAQSSWLNPADGSWFESANWDTAIVPGSADQVTLGLVGGYTVTVPGSADALQLSITNPDAMLHIDNARTLDLFGELTNEGLIIVNPAGGGSFTQFDFESDAMISGSGEIRLGSFGTRARLRTGAGLSVTQGASHSVTGVGTIEAAMVNDGTVDANLTGQLLTLSLNTKVNSGVMRASNAGVLDIRAIVINQGPTGIIEAIDASSEVQLNASTIVGGTLRTDLDAGINVNSATLDGVKLAEGSLNLLNARTLDVLNSITNNGTININPIAGGSATQLDFETSGSFNGSGEVVLGSVGSRARLRTGVGFTMTNSTTHTIRGYGQIEAALINDGLVNADVPGNELLFQTRDKLNNSTIQAINAGILDFGNITVDQQGGGLLLADGAGSRIDFNSSTIVGGTVRATNDAIAKSSQLHSMA